MQEFVIACFAFALTVIFIFLSFFPDYRRGNGLSKLQKWAVLLLIIELVYGIWDLHNRFVSAKNDKKQIIGTVTKSADEVKHRIDSARKVIIDSMKKGDRTVIDSIKNGDDAVVTNLNQTIRSQAHELDSLLRLHAEKHLTKEDEKYIFAKLKQIIKENHLPTKQYSIETYQTSNGATFTHELIQFLASQGFELFGTGESLGGEQLNGYTVTYSDSGIAKVPYINIGVFKL
jgi:hypothetical protein